MRLMSALPVTLVLTTSLCLGACSVAREAVMGPTMSPMGYPAQLMPQDQVVLSAYHHDPVAPSGSPNSLWRIGARR
jgi:flagellar L-ring protein precursor FlgH